jgi:uncharacterized protein with HEPN domain
MSRDRITLGDIYFAILRIEQFVAGLSREEFLADDKTQSAGAAPTDGHW